MAETDVGVASAPRLTKSGILRLVTVLAHTVVLASLFFAAAVTFHASRAWIYYGGTLAYLVAAMVVIFTFFPGTVEIVNAGQVPEDGQEVGQDLRRHLHRAPLRPAGRGGTRRGALSLDLCSRVPVRARA
jgi:hypothetical protein